MDFQVSFNTLIASGIDEQGKAYLHIQVKPGLNLVWWSYDDIDTQFAG